MASLHRSSLFPRSNGSLRRRVPIGTLGLVLVVASISWSGESCAQDDAVKACAEAYEQAQVTRNSGKLKESEEQLRICVREMCPDFVKTDCGQWLSDVRREMPSVILMVTDANGKELTDVRVAIDGTAVSQGLDGRALEINPGPHEITFEREGAKRSERVSIRQGEKNRVIKIELASHQDSDADGVDDARDRCPDEAGEENNAGCPPETPQVPSSPAASGGLDGLQVGAIVAGSVGVLGLGTFAVFGTMSRLNASEAKEQCEDGPEPCTPKEVSAYKDNEALYNPIANVGAAVGGVGMVTAVVLFALSLEDDRASETQVGGVEWSLAPTRGGAWLGASGHF